MQPFAWEKKQFLWNHISARIAWSLTSTLRFRTSSAQTNLETIVCKFGGDPAICVREETIFVKSQKCLYHVTFDLDLDIEHILDAGRAGDHRVQVWLWSSHLPARRGDFRKITSVRMTWPLTSILTWSTSWMQARLETMVCKFGRDPPICLVEAICAKCLQTDTDDGRRTIALAHGMS